jgi:tetratricopeptide (TPR) repeat protein
MSDSAGHIALDADNPWPGLHEFDEGGKEFFNGRDGETAELLRLVDDAPLTVVFGGSGLGKTSLLLAGLVPNLRAHNKLPVYIRLDPRDRTTPLIEQAIAAFRSELAAHGVEYPPFPDSQSLWEYLHRPDFELWSTNNQLLTPVFIFDQFEEVFTLGGENAEAVRQLREDLADLAENRVPAPLAQRFEHPAADPPLELGARRFRLVLSFREDFLADVEDWRSAIPSLVRNRFRLLAMNGRQALAAVIRTGGRLVDPEIGQAIVSFVAAAHTGFVSSVSRVATAAALPESDTDDLASLRIEPALLSLVCTGLNERRKAAHKATIDQELLDGTGLAIVTEFYEGCVRDLPDRARRFIEEKLITESGFRNPYSREDAIAQDYLSNQQLESLVKRRLLRVERHLGTDRIELVHDRLTAVVRTFRDRERARSRRTTERRRMAIGAIGSVALVAGLVFGLHFWQIQMLDSADRQRANALTLASKKDYPQAIALLANPLSIYQRTGDTARTVRALVDRGRIFALVGNHDLADRDLQLALETATRAASAGDEAIALESLASLREQMKNESAMPLYRRALDRYRATGDSASVARLLEWMATQEEAHREFEPAVSKYREALESYRVAGDMIGISRVEEAIGRTESWGFLVDLKRSEVFPLRGGRITVGGGWGDVQNDINFASRSVSRHQLVISHNGFQAEDLRSTNGTTVNAIQLPYAVGGKLADGDLISVGNTEVLQFTTQRPTPPSMPPSTWAIFIDGSTRSYSYLTEPVYSVGLTAAGLRIEKGENGSALLKIREGPQTPKLFVAASEWSVVSFAKRNDYDYPPQILPTREWNALNGWPARLFRLSADRREMLERGPAFQIVTIAAH